MKVIVGCIIMKDDSFVIVKEAKKHVYGKWNLPMGRLDENEKIISGSIRESEEETGLKLKLTGLVGVYHSKSAFEKSAERVVLKVLFSAEPVGSDKIKFPHEELLEAKWITFKDFFKIAEGDFRSPGIIAMVNDYKNRGTIPINYVKEFGF